MGSRMRGGRAVGALTLALALALALLAGGGGSAEAAETLLESRGAASRRRTRHNLRRRRHHQRHHAHDGKSFGFDLVVRHSPGHASGAGHADKVDKEESAGNFAHEPDRWHPVAATPFHGTEVLKKHGFNEVRFEGVGVMFKNTKSRVVDCRFDGKVVPAGKDAHSMQLACTEGAAGDHRFREKYFGAPAPFWNPYRGSYGFFPYGARAHYMGFTNAGFFGCAAVHGGQCIGHMAGPYSYNVRPYGWGASPFGGHVPGVIPARL